MANHFQNDEEYERQMAQRRKQNRIVLLVIGAVLLIILVGFSQVQGAWIAVVGAMVVIGGLLYARSIVERRYKAAARERLKAETLDEDKPQE